MGKVGAQALNRNPNWKGGRTIASNGYVLVKMPGHPMADSRGYVYEHRLVAERKLGRPLLPGEIVHHKDGYKQNDSDENIEVEVNIAFHLAQHRNSNSRRKNPGEPNQLIECACGCGQKFCKYDLSGRPRKFISGHNMYLKGKGCNRYG
ncbi:MAG: HNH endonuclease [Syntrophomonas sp.]